MTPHSIYVSMLCVSLSQQKNISPIAASHLHLRILNLTIPSISMPHAYHSIPFDLFLARLDTRGISFARQPLNKILANTEMEISAIYHRQVDRPTNLKHHIWNYNQVHLLKPPHRSLGLGEYPFDSDNLFSALSTTRHLPWQWSDRIKENNLFLGWRYVLEHWCIHW